MLKTVVTKNIKIYTLLLNLVILCSCAPDTAPPPTGDDNSINISMNLDNPAKVPIEIYQSSSQSMNNFKDRYLKIVEYTKTVANKLSKDNAIIKNSSLNNIFQETDNKQKNSAGDKLKIVITDFSNNSGNPEQLNTLSNDLTEKYLKKGLSIGLIKLDSDFAGKIVNQNQSYNYNGQRNFYILLLGKYDNIFNFYKNLKKTSQELSNGSITMQNQNFAILSNNIIFRTIHFGEAGETVNSPAETSSVGTEQYQKVFQLDIKDDKGNKIEENPLFVETPDDRIKQYSLPASSTNITFENTFSFHKIYFTPDFRLLKANIKVENFNSEKREFENDDNLVKSIKVEGYEVDKNIVTQKTEEDDKKILKKLEKYQYSDKTTNNIINVVRDNSLCKYRLNMDLAKFTEGLIYRIQVTLYPSQSANISNINNMSDSNYTLSNPYQDWSIGSSDFNRCVQSNGRINGDTCGKTLNLRTFIDKLLESINQNETNKQIKVAEFFYYIKKQ